MVGGALFGRIHRHHRLPPFSPFLSEFTIVSSIFSQKQPLVGALFLLFLAIIFLGMASSVLPVVMGRMTPAVTRTSYRDSFLTVGPPLFLMASFWYWGYGCRPR